jgi:hypothetical protein
MLARRISSQPGPYVFPSPTNPQQHRGPTWREHGEVLEASVLLFVPYDWRHTFASRAAFDGMPLPVLAAILGHANLRSVSMLRRSGLNNFGGAGGPVRSRNFFRIFAGYPNREQAKITQICPTLMKFLDGTQMTDSKRKYLILYWRRGSGSNRRIRVLQTLALPLGYRAVKG